MHHVAPFAVLLSLFGVAAAPGGESQVTFASLLAEMTDRAVLAQFPDPAYTCRQFSSYDRASATPGDESWWANADAGKFLRTEQVNGRTEHVMMDAAGPGAIVRIWSANPKGTLRIYLDGGDEPAIEAPMADFLSGKGGVPEPLSAIRSRGYNLYLPIPYATRCLITSDEPGFYYQINYRTYENGTTVEPFTRDLLSAHRDALEATCGKLAAGAAEVTAAPGSLDYFVSLKPGNDAAVAQLGPRKGDGSGMAITGLTLQVHNSPRTQAEMERALRDVILTATFDGEQTIWCPVGDFFGSGVGLNAFSGFYRSVSAGDETSSAAGGRLTSRWVMPYEKSATIALHNLGDLPLEMDLLIDLEPLDWTDRSMHFFARWRAEHPIHTRGGTGTTDFNYVTIQGRGVYVGDTLAIMNPIGDWWGEGDEKIFVDGESFPSHFGTGTEDYYGYAWCSPEPFEAPFHAQPRSDGQAHGNNWGHATVTRTRALDAIPFTTSLQMDMEIWHWREADVAYAATSYFYARPGATHNRSPAPDQAAAAIPQAPPLPPPFKIAGAIEAEQMQITAKSDGLVAGPQGGFAPGVWSGEEHLWVRAREPGDFIELTFPAPPSPDKAGHEIHAYLTRSFDYGIVKLSINGRPAPPPAPPATNGAASGAGGIDTYNTDAHWVDTIGPITLGAHTPVADADGNPVYRLRIEAVGANERSEGARYFFGIDCVVLGSSEARP